MDITFLKSFLILAETKNITRAAERLNISPSALSNALRKIEDEIGKPLFDRVNNRLRLNDDGVFFLNYAQKMIVHSEDMHRVLQESATKRGVIKIGVSLETDTLLILLSAFMERHPDICIQLYGELALQDNWLSSDLDFFVVNRSDQRGLDGVMFARWDNLFVLMREGHPLSARASIRLSDLKDADFVFSLNGIEERNIEWTYDYCMKCGLRPNVSYLCDGFDGKLDVVANSDALALVQNTMRQFRESMTGIKAVPLETDNRTVEDIVITWRSTPINPLANVLLDFVEEFAKRGREAYM